MQAASQEALEIPGAPHPIHVALAHAEAIASQQAPVEPRVVDLDVVGAIAVDAHVDALLSPEVFDDGLE
ncbi:MAG: hypothetical protein L0Z46_00825 [Nitrospiraceae bacterium]|nr:hypothetical protein [Nitrospiraceae bacterium]